jgi:GAF domain-containing protein
VSSPERGTVSVIAAPVITTGRLFGALTAARAADDAFPAGAEIRLRSFADLAAQSIANERAQATPPHRLPHRRRKPLICGASKSG